MTKPTQAVILAGGRGERLRPLTDTVPKPMIAFHGTPFLDYLLELLREQGIERVVLLLGYLPEAIRSYCGDGSRWGLSIDYAVSPVEDDTGRRLQQAASKLDPIFLLMYCDNYWPLQLDRLWRQFSAAEASAAFVVYRNDDRHTRDNVAVDADGFVTRYDKDRTAAGLRGVEIGFAICRREALALLPDGNPSFEREVYPRLAAQRKLRALVTDHRYYSVSSPERLPATEQFLARRPAIILDRDGVLNRKPARAEYVRSWADWQWLPGALEALRRLKDAGWRVVIVSNQAGIARGVMTEAQLDAVHAQLRQDVRQAGGEIDAIYHCPHGWDEGCACRKPAPGLLFQAQRQLALDLSRTYFIGDDERDGRAAEAAGCPWKLVSDQVTLLDVVREVLEEAYVAR